MILHRIAEPALAQVGYLVGCEIAREVLAVDPTRDIVPFLEAAEALDVRIVGVTETHVHADFISGARALAAVTGATLYLSGEGPDAYQYDKVDEKHPVTWLHDGDTITIGSVAIRAMHTPGHTPEHLAFEVADGEGEKGGAALASPNWKDEKGGAALASLGLRRRPYNGLTLITGDFLFVGDVGRPDLLEKAVGVAGSAEAGARQLFHSLGKLSELPDATVIWPGHGAGSACGKNLGAEASTTLGAERKLNWAFAAMARGEDAFVAEVLAGQPTPPAYFARMKELNRRGPPLTRWWPPESRTVTTLPTVPLLDARSAAAFAEGHAPGALNIPLNMSFATWAGALLSPDQHMVLGVPHDCDDCSTEATRRLALIGLESVVSEILRIDASVTLHDALPQVAVSELTDNGPYVLDVRNDGEWAAGHIPYAHHIPLAALPTRLAELPKDNRIVVHCQSGGRSAIAASFLLGHGFIDVANLTGGYSAWASWRRT